MASSHAVRQNSISAARNGKRRLQRGNSTPLPFDLRFSDGMSRQRLCPGETGAF